MRTVMSTMESHYSTALQSTDCVDTCSTYCTMFLPIQYCSHVLCEASLMWCLQCPSRNMHCLVWTADTTAWQLQYWAICILKLLHITSVTGGNIVQWGEQSSLMHSQTDSSRKIYLYNWKTSVFQSFDFRWLQDAHWYQKLKLKVPCHRFW